MPSRANTIKSDKTNSKIKDFAVLDDMTASDLFALEKPVNIAVIVGHNEKKLFLDFELPAPTDKDLKWADKIWKKTPEKRASELIKAVKEDNLWRISYLVKVYKEKDFDKDWFDPNFIRPVKILSTRSLLSEVVECGSKEAVALFLQCRDVDVNKKFYVYQSIYMDERKNSLHYLLTGKNNTDTSIDILRMLTGFELDVTEEDIIKAKDAVIREILHDILKEQEIKLETTTDDIAEDDVDSFCTLEDGAVWQKLDDKTICRSVSTDDGFRLRKIFCFHSSRITEIGETLDKDGNVKVIGQPVVAPMVQAASQSEIKQAQKILKEMKQSEQRTREVKRGDTYRK